MHEDLGHRYSVTDNFGDECHANKDRFVDHVIRANVGINHIEVDIIVKD